MYSYVTPADDAPVRIFGHRAGRDGPFWGAFLATFARHWYTGKRFLDEISERIFDLAKATISEEECTAMSHPRMMLRAVLGRFFGHLCTALAHREAVFGRNFGAIFEHAKATISGEQYTAMSHWEMTPRAGFGSAV